MNGLGYSQGYGPGYGSEGGSYGGVGAYFADNRTYGSFLSPTNLGSGGYSGGADGGGAVRLTVSGTLTNNGEITAGGWGTNLTAGAAVHGGGAGGSIYLTVGALAGTGPIRANGGLSSTATARGTGGGGRIAVVVTNAGADFSGFSGSIEAYSQNTDPADSTGRRGGAGSVYRQTAAQGAGKGTVTLDNDSATAGGLTWVPPYTNFIASELSNAAVCITNGVKLKLSDSVSLDSMNLAYTNVTLDLTNRMLTVLSLTITNQSYAPGSYTTSSLPRLVTGAGTVTVVQATALAVDDTAATTWDTPITIEVLTNDLGIAPLWVAAVTQPTNGGVQRGSTVITNSSTAVYFSPSNNYDGDYVFGYVVSNQYGTDEGSVTVAVSPAGTQPPQATDDTAATAEDTAVVINVLANDTDPDTDLTNLTVSAVTQPTNAAGTVVGTAGINAPANTNVTFTPNLNFNGTAWFTYTVQDDSLNSDTGAVTVTVSAVNDAPVAVDDSVFTPMDTAVTISVLANDTDADADTLSIYSYDATSLRGGSVSVSDVTNLVYTPPAGFAGLDSFNYVVEDTGGLRDTGTVSVSVNAYAWTGAGANELASNSNNWQDARLPSGTTPCIVLNGAGPTGQKNMTWNAGVSGLPDAVGSWIQAGYTGTVTFLTKFPGQGTFTNFAIASDCMVSNGVWTHLDNSNAESNRLCATVGGNLTVGAGASINADGLGYDANNGPGKASVSGGSYGGIGASITNNRTYGSFLSPTNLGSGGRQAAGGGAVRLTVGGALTNNGVISAGGQRGTSNHGGGAGGSIWLTVGSLGGGGVIRADGGLSKTGVNDGGGGGGRIAVVLTGGGGFTDFSGIVQAYGGVDSDGNYPAAAGTLYEETQAQGAGEGTLIVDNSNRVCLAESVTAIPSNQTWNVRHVLLRKGGILAVEPLSALALTSDDVTSDDTSTTDGIRLHGGSLTLTAGTLSITNWSLIVDGANSVAGNVRVCSGGVIKHSDNTTAETYLMNLSVTGNLTVDAGGQINVNGLGYDAANGPGKGPYFVSAGSYGGQGFNLTTNYTYGLFLAPTNLGSGGSQGAGGGAVRLTVSGTLTNNGEITAGGWGTNLTASAVHGPGSGGSIWLTADTLAGNGPIRANGGLGRTDTGSGSAGGGRIAIVLTGSGADFAGFSGSVEAYSLNSDASLGKHGGAGTIYRQTAAQGAGKGTVTMDNDSATAGGLTLVPPYTNFVAGEVKDATLYVTNGVTLSLTNNFEVGNIWLQSANVVLDLNYMTLTVHSVEHTLNPGTTNHPGAIVWLPKPGGPGTIVTVR